MEWSKTNVMNPGYVMERTLAAGQETEALVLVFQLFT